MQLSNYCFRILYFALRNFGMNFGPPGLTDSTGIVGFCRRRWVACSIMTVPHSGFIAVMHTVAHARNVVCLSRPCRHIARTTDVGAS